MIFHVPRARAYVCARPRLLCVSAANAAIFFAVLLCFRVWFSQNGSHDTDFADYSCRQILPNPLHAGQHDRRLLHAPADHNGRTPDKTARAAAVQTANPLSRSRDHTIHATPGFAHSVYPVGARCNIHCAPALCSQDDDRVSRALTP